MSIRIEIVKSLTILAPNLGVLNNTIKDYFSSLEHNVFGNKNCDLILLF